MDLVVLRWIAEPARVLGGAVQTGTLWVELKRPLRHMERHLPDHPAVCDLRAFQPRNGANGRSRAGRMALRVAHETRLHILVKAALLATVQVGILLWQLVIHGVHIPIGPQMGMRERAAQRECAATMCFAGSDGLHNHFPERAGAAGHESYMTL